MKNSKNPEIPGKVIWKCQKIRDSGFLTPKFSKNPRDLCGVFRDSLSPGYPENEKSRHFFLVGWDIKKPTLMIPINSYINLKTYVWKSRQVHFPVCLTTKKSDISFVQFKNRRDPRWHDRSPVNCVRWGSSSLPFKWQFQALFALFKSEKKYNMENLNYGSYEFYITSPIFVWKTVSKKFLIIFSTKVK